MSSETEEIKKEAEEVHVEESKQQDADDELPTDDSDLSNLDRRIWVVTTAGMPWRTGTAVNPLLRALYLTRGRPKHHVTLLIPWLPDPKSRKQLYGKDNFFATCTEQEEWIRDFCRTRAHCEAEEGILRIQFYESVYQAGFGSIFPTVDICGLIPDDEADVAILEEPEHLNWIRVPKVNEEDGDSEDNEKKERDMRQLGWTYKFRHVVGILHTNYAAYMKDYGLGAGLIAAPAISMLSSIVVRAYCHRVIRLSAVLPSLAPKKEVTSNVHGVRFEFLTAAVPRADDSDEFYAPVYFIGKIIWAKGFDKLLELQELYKKSNGDYFEMDIYGGGNDEKHIARALFGRKKLSNIESGEELKDEDRTPSANDLKALEVFDEKSSLRRKLSAGSKEAAEAQSFEVIRSQSGRSEDIVESGENPFSIIGDLSGKTLWTGLAASKAIYSLGNAMAKTGLNMSFVEKEDSSDSEGEQNATKEIVEGDKEKTKKKFVFDPPRNKYEFRRHPIPARFLGVKDHAELRDIPEHKIFLNMSITEVLCTTTAEALAMGKFAIIPKHRK